MALQTLRKHSKGWVAGILFAVLIVAFAVWGIGDMLRTGGPTGPVIVVGTSKVEAREFDQVYRRQIQTLENQLRRNIDYALAKQLGIVDGVIAQIVTERLILLEAAARGIVISDKIVRDEIMAAAAFKGADGRFSAFAFQRALNGAGLTEADYVQGRKVELAREYLLGTIGAIETSPKAIADKVFAYRSELRVADVMTVLASAMKVADPDAAALEAYHKANAAKFTAPEYRALTIVWVTPALLAERVKLTKEEVKAEYEKRIATFTTPESRNLQQIQFPDEETAKKAYAALQGGRTFEAVAQEFTKAKPVDLGKVKKADMPIPALADAAFALKAGEVSAPVKSAFGWHIILCLDITPEVVRPLADVERELEKEMRLREAVKQLPKLRDDIDDALGGGQKIDAVARKYDLPVVKVASVDARGLDAEGKKVEGLPTDPEFLARAFKQGKGEEGEIVDQRSAGFYMVRVDDIVASKLRPLESVKEAVTLDWRTAEQLKAAKAEAERLAGLVRGGQAFAAVAEAASLEVKRTKPIPRGETGGEDAAAEGSIEQRVFAAKIGDVIVAPDGTTGWSIARIEAGPDAEKPDEKAREKFLTDYRRAFGDDLVAGFQRHLRASYPISVDRAAIDQIYTTRR
jgi:peptidyl-prolyl cis-trans isomerase D